MPDFIVALTSEWARLSFPLVVGMTGVWCLLDDWTKAAPVTLAAQASTWAIATSALAVGLAVEASVRALWSIGSLCGIGADLVLYAWRYALAMQGALLLSGTVPLAALLVLRAAAARRAAVDAGLQRSRPPEALAPDGLPVSSASG